MDNSVDSNVLLELISYKMPFGRHRDKPICDLPENYLLWFSQKGFPAGKLGMLMASMYEIQINGLEYLLKPLKNNKF
jgi:uncharacterized protein (DUF3820 family)